MNRKPEYPEFSSIRSHVERADAVRSVEIGYALADALVDAGNYLGRAFSGARKTVMQFIGALQHKG